MLQLKSDTTITIDDEVVTVYITRLTKAEVIQFRKDFARHGHPRGTESETAEQAEVRKTEADAYIEASIRAYVSFKPGDVMIGETAIVTGDQIIETFYGRIDVIRACYQLIYSENCLGKAEKKKLRSLDVFSPGSAPSTPSPVGDGPASTVPPVVPSITASAAAATASPAPEVGGASGS